MATVFQNYISEWIPVYPYVMQNTNRVLNQVFLWITHTLICTLHISALGTINLDFLNWKPLLKAEKRTCHECVNAFWRITDNVVLSNHFPSNIWLHGSHKTHWPAESSMNATMKILACICEANITLPPLLNLMLVLIEKFYVQCLT